MKQINIIEDILIASGIVVTVSLEQVYTIFGIILLAVQIGLIIAKGVIKVVDHVKKKKLEEAVKDIEDTQKEINDITGKDK